MSEKKSRGRQKIEMKRIENEDDRLITFSKRRSGIYKKASELITLCGAEIFVGIFSPSGKPFTFCDPSTESISNRFLGKIPPENDYTQNLIEAYRKIRINELHQHYDEVHGQLEAEKESAKTLKQLMGDEESQGWWDASIEKLNLEQLEQMDSLFEDMQMNILSKISERIVAPGINALDYSTTFATPSSSNHLVQGGDHVNHNASVGASSSSHPPMDPNSYTSGTHPPNFPYGSDFRPHNF
ncbi:SRF-TF domain-containing protein [Cephalotus follicularis]|uniref:SRF-TF domain-containing protein n=1 Tax=Cephalotus follicularis TaxID=3775 RepID=A0A1Q3AX32_CEPFO|nr:SRF-TF domain-containing protein [Cephalotus follicularis]